MSGVYLRHCKQSKVVNDSTFDNWKKMCKEYPWKHYIHVDNGITEVDTNTECAIGWIVED